MSNTVFYNPNIALDTNHQPSAGAKAYFYDTGTTDLQTVYTDKALSVAHPSPVVADSAGVFAAVYSADTTDLKVVVKTTADATLYTIDPANVHSTGGGASTVAFTPTARIAATNTQAAIEEVDAAVAVVEKATGTVYATAGSSNAYTIAVADVTAYTSGDVYNVRLDRTNTGAATLNVEGVGAKDWQSYDTAGALLAYGAGGLVDGSELKVLYDGTRFVSIGHRHPLHAQAVWTTGTSVDEAIISPSKLTATTKTYLLHVRDEKTSGTLSGTFTTGSFQTRVLNTVVTNEILGASLASNTITLPAGTYYVEATLPAFNTNGHKSQLYNVSDTSSIIEGTGGYSGSSVQDTAHVKGRFTLAAEKDVTLRHSCQTTRVNDGFGVSTNLAASTTEVFAEVLIWKIP
jgi:hypothetical protein